MWVSRVFLRAIVACSCAWLSQAQAHHSFSAYDNNKTVTIQGVVKSFEWTNPHSWMHVLVGDATGRTVVWDIECGAPNINVRLGWSASDVKPGDKVSVAFHPRRDGTFGGTLASVTLADGRTLMGNGGRNGPVSGGGGPAPANTGTTGTSSASVSSPAPSGSPGAPSTALQNLGQSGRPSGESNRTGSIPAFLAPYQKPVPPGYPLPSPDPHNLEGAYINPRLVAANAQPPPYRPQTLERVKYLLKMTRAGTPVGTLSDICRPLGMAAELSLNFPFKIIQTAHEVLILEEEMHATIRIHLDQPLPVKAPVSYEGYSVGHWQGDTLVVETVGIDARTALGVGPAPDPHSEALHQTLRIRKLDGGKHLELTFSFDDPQAYTKPWSRRPIVVDWRPDYGAFSEYDCEETAGSAEYAARYGVKVRK